MEKNKKNPSGVKLVARFVIGFWAAAALTFAATAAGSPPIPGKPGPAASVSHEMISGKQISRIRITVAQSPAGPGGAESDNRTGKPAGNASKDQGVGYQKALERVMDMIFVYLDSLEKRTDISPAEKKQKAIDFIRNVRWGPENKYYFWINDLDGKMILEPLYPKTEGTSVIKYKDLNSREIFVEFINSTLKDGQGFVNHNGLGYDANWSAKVSLVRLFGAWDWVVGTYVKLDDVQAYEETGELQFVIPLAPIDDQAPASGS